MKVCSNGAIAASAAVSGSSVGAATRSTLFSTSQLRRFCSASVAAIERTASAGAGLRIDQQQRQIRIAHAGPGRRHHRAIQLACAA